ncbi:phage PhiH1 repressor protein [Halodesulfurarchaeum formicicum]|uniref:Phage PhiH1 repressor protein n=1 Tax=Halodesulfurarchaeum formicicum TaxID=1873524 RepID=A0A1D8S2R7_9EURY|nr:MULTISPECIES: phage repressor protein [Halodesulfurarchaeum]AOW79645.1 phage PhiH1 repressor protein [Halodesulfurarchaeum formicicum]APE94896.1 phage PhiH1 repressor protein [Halodesulfurarchaeum formicicum]MDR5655729.1 ArsR family transcriptional regulator [Halodesulfurarchaeum sp. HSR-GB]
MRLAEPTDFEILEALSDGKRNTAANLSYILDKDRSYINTRLPILADYGLVDRVGPAPNSGLYEITERGIAVIDIRESATEGADIDFDARLEERLGA